jgi:hypothetical protein
MQCLSKYVERELSLHSVLRHPFVIGFKRARSWILLVLVDCFNYTSVHI